MVEYIGTYPAVNDLPMLAASRGRINNAPTYMYLSASASFVIVHGDYSKAQGSEESASLSTFRQLWKSTTRTSILRNPTRTFVRPVSKIEINCAVLHLKVTRTYLWRIGWHILIKGCIYSTIFEFCRPRIGMQSEPLWALIL